MSFIFERPWLVGLVLAVVVVVMARRWAVVGTRAAARDAWVTLGLAIGLLVLNVAIVTPRERITAICHELAAAAEAGDVQVIRGYVADSFTAAGVDRAAFMDQVESTLTRYHLEEAKVWSLDVVIGPSDTATAEFFGGARVIAADAFLDQVFARWRLTFVRTAAGWRVSRVEVLPTPLSPIRSLDQVLR